MKTSGATPKLAKGSSRGGNTEGGDASGRERVEVVHVRTDGEICDLAERSGVLTAAGAARPHTAAPSRWLGERADAAVAVENGESVSVRGDVRLIAARVRGQMPRLP